MAGAKVQALAALAAAAAAAADRAADRALSRARNGAADSAISSDRVHSCGCNGGASADAIALTCASLRASAAACRARNSRCRAATCAADGGAGAAAGGDDAAPADATDADDPRASRSNTGAAAPPAPAITPPVDPRRRFTRGTKVHSGSAGGGLGDRLVERYLRTAGSGCAERGRLRRLGSVQGRARARVPALDWLRRAIRPVQRRLEGALAHLVVVPPRSRLRRRLPAGAAAPAHARRASARTRAGARARAHARRRGEERPPLAGSSRLPRRARAARTQARHRRRTAAAQGCWRRRRFRARSLCRHGLGARTAAEVAQAAPPSRQLP